MAPQRPVSAGFSSTKERDGEKRLLGMVSQSQYEFAHQLIMIENVATPQVTGTAHSGNFLLTLLLIHAIDMSSEPPQKKIRRPNFSEDELLMMITEAAKRKNLVIEKKFDSGEVVSAKAIESAWDDITKEVNSVSKVKRTTADVRKKFRDMRSYVKNKKAKDTKETKKTGKDSQVIVNLSLTLLRFPHKKNYSKYYSVTLNHFD